MVAFVNQRHKAQGLSPCRRLNAQPRVSRPAGHGLRDSEMRRFLRRVSRYARRGNAGLGEQLVKQHARAGAKSAVHVAHIGARQVGERAHAQGVASGNDQTLRAMRKADQFVPAGLEQAAVGFGGNRLPARLVNCVKTCQRAAPGVECCDGIDAAHEPDVQVQAALTGVLAQRGQRRIVAGIKRQHMSAVVKGAGKGALDVAAQSLDLRRQPRLRLSFGPQQLLAEFRQLCALALVPDDQRAAQLVLPVLQSAPDIAVRKPQ